MTYDDDPSTDAGPADIPLGRFRHDPSVDGWWWSDELYRMYDVDPTTVTPSLELALSRVHPDDRQVLARVFERALLATEPGEVPFAAFHRLRPDGRDRHVLTCGHSAVGADGAVTLVTGYMLDLTDRRHADNRADVEEAIARVTERRAEIEQAKGALMTQYGIDADQAFSVLSAYSQRANLKVRDVARQIVEAATSDGLSGPVARQRLDSLLASIAQRDGGPGRAGRQPAP